MVPCSKRQLNSIPEAMKKNLYIPKVTRECVVSYCNKHIVPDDHYIANPTYSHPIEWFKEYFSFILDNALQKYLAEAFYQARFAYKIMQGLKLTSFKKTAFLKFQIQQYASIYEALLDYTLETYHKEEIKNDILKTIEYRPVSAFANPTEMFYTEGKKKEKIYTCKKKEFYKALKSIKIDDKTKIAFNYGIFDLSVKADLDALYDIRNCIHLLKAAQSDYRPTIKECERAFKLMPRIVNAIKSHIANRNN